MYEWHHLRTSINFGMHEIRLGTITTGAVKNNFKRTIEMFAASDNALSFMSSVKGTAGNRILETVFT